MTLNEHFNLYWLGKAITAPQSSDRERYYYDLLRRDFFSTINLLQNPPLIVNKFNFSYPEEIENDLAVRLNKAANDSTLIEIPRLNIAYKVAIQLQFLSTLPDKACYDEFLAVINQQQDLNGFALDVLLDRHSNSPCAPYWENLKLELAMAYLNTLTTLQVTE